MVRPAMKETERGGPVDMSIRKPPPADIRGVNGIWSPLVYSSLRLDILTSGDYGAILLHNLSAANTRFKSGAVILRFGSDSAGFPANREFLNRWPDGSQPRRGLVGNHLEGTLQQVVPPPFSASSIHARSITLPSIAFAHPCTVKPQRLRKPVLFPTFQFQRFQILVANARLTSDDTLYAWWLLRPLGRCS